VLHLFHESLLLVRRQVLHAFHGFSFPFFAPTDRGEVLWGGDAGGR
jgi:hypothetical protein